MVHSIIYCFIAELFPQARVGALREGYFGGNFEIVKSSIVENHEPRLQPIKVLTS